jgi:hypothetical protein
MSSAVASLSISIDVATRSACCNQRRCAARLFGTAHDARFMQRAGKPVVHCNRLQVDALDAARST